ncbi:MAG: hypothetical protein ACJAYG_002780 [Oceanicoccus sp.]|jgi:hypothetical protein
MSRLPRPICLLIESGLDATTLLFIVNILQDFFGVHGTFKRREIFKGNKDLARLDDKNIIQFT